MGVVRPPLLLKKSTTGCQLYPRFSVSLFRQSVLFLQLGVRRNSSWLVRVVAVFHGRSNVMAKSTAKSTTKRTKSTAQVSNYLSLIAFYPCTVISFCLKTSQTLLSCAIDARTTHTPRWNRHLRTELQIGDHCQVRVLQSICLCSQYIVLVCL